MTNLCVLHLVIIKSIPLVLSPICLQEEDNNDQLVSYIELTSTLLCIYGSQALLIASNQILNEYKINGKFRVIQIGVITLSLPSAIIGIINIDDENDIYTSEIMSTAIATVINCVVFMLLSFGFVYYFNEQTANEAYTNLRNESFVVPKMDQKEDRDGDKASNQAHEVMGNNSKENDVELQTEN